MRQNIRYGLGSLGLILLLYYWVSSFNLPLEYDPTSTIILDQNQQLLAAQIASDGQWRFEGIELLPEKYQKAVLLFEDEYFHYHPGFNPISMLKALWYNLQQGEIKRGGSTLSMQVIRLSRKNQPRTLIEKMIEVLWALRLELKYTKNEILQIYATHAPFGGNVVGLSAATWRYFGRNFTHLTWAESATLAVLPNAPALIHPGKNRSLLLEKRNRLLLKLLEKQIINNETYQLAISEELPSHPFPIPQFTPHLLQWAIKQGLQGQRIITSIQRDLQIQMQDLISNQHRQLAHNEIHNAAILIIDIKKNQVISYVGNTDCDHQQSGKNVDIIQSLRSTGSTLKPFLYAAMLEEGLLLKNSLVLDIPTQIAGYVPQNFEKKFDGIVPASAALSRSLNIPAVRQLQQFGVEHFYHILQDLEFESINKGAHHYGLSLILGGAESSLWDLAKAYHYLAQKVNHQELSQPEIFLSHQEKKNTPSKLPFSEFNLYQTFDVLASLTRPESLSSNYNFNTQRKIAWKTGTSFGHRDAWAIGLTPEYLIGVWVGNADGEGRPGLTGIQVAAPLMFDAWAYLPKTTWFKLPSNGFLRSEICSFSGMRAHSDCPQTQLENISVASTRSNLCSFHKKIYLDTTQQFRVNSSCYPVHLMKEFVPIDLSPTVAFFYKKIQPNYREIPPWLPTCQLAQRNTIDIIYPSPNQKIFIPKNLDSTISPPIFEAAHQQANQAIYWYLNDQYLGTTNGAHKMEVNVPPGTYQLVLTDKLGSTTIQKVTFVEK